MFTVIDIRMSAAVRELLGAEMIARVREVPLAQARCPICLTPVPPTGPVNVVISAAGSQGRIAYAHVGCAPSAVLPGPAAPLDDLLPDEGPMNMRAALIEHGRSILPVLVAEVPIQAYAMPRNQGNRGEATNIIVSALLTHGLTLITRLREAPRPVLDWTATLTRTDGGGPDHLVISRPPDDLLREDLFYDGTVILPAAWAAALDAYGWCVLYGGTGLADPVTDLLTARSLRAAAAAGTLTGARLRIRSTLVGVDRVQELLS